ncbi:MAG: HEPN domain-containing protein [Candidatus Kapabacteria bacterium]|nr:HEPN domain-containing protein [Ignavibacteriota bacterium]MCW5886094.1 HEPN domain-containing protein [Candidatus Kapabacteria bacterium]
MNIEEKIKYWSELADDDLITAEIILNSKRYLHFGFLCHLIAERYIKAYYWKNLLAEPPYTHNLLVLSSKSGLNEVIPENFKQLLFKLMPLNIQARYPTSKDKIYQLLTYDYCTLLLSEIKEFSVWIKNFLTS